MSATGERSPSGSPAAPTAGPTARSVLIRTRCLSKTWGVFRVTFCRSATIGDPTHAEDIHLSVTIDTLAAAFTQASPNVIRIRPSRGWRHRLARGLAVQRAALVPDLRDIKLRYKQTALGISWAVLQPLFTMTFHRLLRQARQAAVRR